MKGILKLAFKLLIINKAKFSVQAVANSNGMPDFVLDAQPKELSR